MIGVVALGLSMLDVQTPSCLGASQWLAGPALAAAQTNDALDLLERSKWRECVEVADARVYLEGLEAAERAWRLGGGDAALAPVRERIARLDTRVGSGSRVAAVARVVLAATVAAAQNEAAELALLLDEATALERELMASPSGGVLVVQVAEVAGDCWLRLYRYRDAARAYREVRGRARTRVAAKLRRAQVGVATRTRR